MYLYSDLMGVYIQHTAVPEMFVVDEPEVFYDYYSWDEWVAMVNLNVFNSHDGWGRQVRAFPDGYLAAGDWREDNAFSARMPEVCGVIWLSA
jgi:hypothetical protein